VSQRHFSARRHGAALQQGEKEPTLAIVSGTTIADSDSPHKVIGVYYLLGRPKPPVQVKLLTYISGTFDPDKAEPSTPIVFLVTLLGEDHLSKLRFDLDFRSPRTAQGVDDLLIVDHAPVDRTSRNPRGELDNTRALLSPSTTTIIWDFWTMGKSSDAISPGSHDFEKKELRTTHGKSFLWKRRPSDIG
jgi:hypothetical protein